MNIFRRMESLINTGSLANTRSFSSKLPTKPNHCILIYSYVKDIVEKRPAHRSAHIEYGNKYVEKGKLLLGGAFQDPLDSAAIIFQGMSKSEVETFAKNDPYVLHGLVTEWKVREWLVVIGSKADLD